MDFKFRRINRESSKDLDRDCLAYLGLEMDLDNEIGIQHDSIKHIRRFNRVVENVLGIDLIFAECAGGVVALVYTNSREHLGRNVVLESIYVKPEFRNEGLGSRLIDFVEKTALQRGYDGVLVPTQSKGLREICSERGYVQAFDSMFHLNFKK